MTASCRLSTVRFGPLSWIRARSILSQDGFSPYRGTPGGVGGPSSGVDGADQGLVQPSTPVPIRFAHRRSPLGLVGLTRKIAHDDRAQARCPSGSHENHRVADRFAGQSGETEGNTPLRKEACSHTR